MRGLDGSNASWADRNSDRLDPHLCVFAFQCRCRREVRFSGLSPLADLYSSIRVRRSDPDRSLGPLRDCSSCPDCPAVDRSALGSSDGHVDRLLHRAPSHGPVDRGDGAPHDPAVHRGVVGWMGKRSRFSPNAPRDRPWVRGRPRYPTADRQRLLVLDFAADPGRHVLCRGGSANANALRQRKSHRSGAFAPWLFAGRRRAWRSRRNPSTVRHIRSFPLRGWRSMEGTDWC